MGIGGFAQDWDEVDEREKEGREPGDGSGGISENDRLYKFRFSLPSPRGTQKYPNLVNPPMPAKKRVLFLNSKVFTIYEHTIFKNPFAQKVLGGFNTVCVPRSSANWDGPPCPICTNKDMKSYARFMGFFPIIDMGQVERKGQGADDIILHHSSWKDKEDQIHYNRFKKCLLPAPKGSDDKPGLLSVLKYKAKEMGIPELAYTVWDATRTGDKTAWVGDDWSFVKQLNNDEEVVAYLKKFGATDDEIDIEVPVFIQRDPEKEETEPGVFDFNIPDLMRKQAVAANQPVTGNGSGGGSSVSGAGFGGGYNNDAPPPGDDDIPF